MDNNIQQPEPVGETTPTAPKEHSRFLQLFLVLIVLGIFLLGGTYLFIRSQKTSLSLPPAPVKNTVVENQKELYDMNTEVETVEANDVDADLQQVDQEMKNL